MSVPIQNVYYLLCYAWSRLEARSLINVGAVPGNRVENLLGQVLYAGVSRLLASGLERGYLEFEEEGRRLRGKIMLSETVKRLLLPSGRVACQLDELSYDIPLNRVIKAAMSELIGVPSLDGHLRAALSSHCRRMADVADVDLSLAAFRNVQLHRNVARYAFLIEVSRLVARSLLPDKTAGRKRFHPFDTSDQEMGLLFEDFVRNFLRIEQNTFKVEARKVPWDLALGGSDPDWLPEMRTDVLLTSPSRRVVLEAKFYTTRYQSHYGTKKLRSGHLYQLLAYLSQLRATTGPAPIGVLLYAGSDENQRLDYRLSGHTVLIRGLDLNRHWQEIHQDLLGLTEELRESA
jgi:5-methylcytosine-specific restriction enzyme subunit McrC